MPMPTQRNRTRDQLLTAQAEFHLKQARLPCLQKMKIVDTLLDNPWEGGAGARLGVKASRLREQAKWGA